MPDKYASVKKNFCTRLGMPYYRLKGHNNFLIGSQMAGILLIFTIDTSLSILFVDKTLKIF